MTSSKPTWSMNDLEQAYLNSRAYKLLAPATRVNTVKALQWLAPFAKRRLDTLTKAEMNSVVERLSPGNAHIFLSRSRALFSYARNLDQMNNDPLKGLKSPASGEYRPWTQEEVDAFLKGAHPTVSLAVRLAYYTGQRMSDVLNMQWSDITDKGIHVVQQKTGAELTIPVHPKLRAELKKQAQASASQYIISQPDGSAYTPASFRTKFRRERIRLKLSEDMVFHGVRKLTAVSLAERGASVREIMAVGGWKSSKQVDHYCKGADQKRMAKSAIDKLGAL